MKGAKIHKVIVIIQFLIGFQMSYAQEINDSILDNSDLMITSPINYLDVNNAKWVTIGSQYDFFSSTFGLVISNGYDERPLIHFEDFSEDLIFKIQGNSDFNKSYSFKANLGWKHPFKFVSLFSLGFNQYDYSKRELYYRDFNISTETFLTKLDLAFILKISYQTLNDLDNVGAELGIRKVVFYRKLYSGLSIGYHFDYLAYSAYLQGFVYKDIFSLRLDYERIDKYDFLTLGLNFLFNR